MLSLGCLWWAGASLASLCLLELIDRRRYQAANWVLAIILEIVPGIPAHIVYALSTQGMSKCPCRANGSEQRYKKRRRYPRLPVFLSSIWHSHHKVIPTLFWTFLPVFFLSRKAWAYMSSWIRCCKAGTSCFSNQGFFFSHILLRGEGCGKTKYLGK